MFMRKRIFTSITIYSHQVQFDILQNTGCTNMDTFLLKLITLSPASRNNYKNNTHPILLPLPQLLFNTCILLHYCPVFAGLFCPQLAISEITLILK